MEKHEGFWFRLQLLFLRFIFSVLSVGPVPNHIAVIMDGNRRYAKKRNLPVGEGHRAGFKTMKKLLLLGLETGIKYATVYAFSIDNFKRDPEEVQGLMDLLIDKLAKHLKEGSIVHKYRVRLHFVGNLKLLRDDTRKAMENAMKVTAKNDRVVLCVCVAYSSTDEILNAIEVACNQTLSEVDIKVVDIGRRMYMSVVPDPDIIVQSSGENRLSNFLLYQSDKCLLYYPTALWPDIGLRHLIWGLLSYQRNHSYFEKLKKQS